MLLSHKSPLSTEILFLYRKPEQQTARSHIIPPIRVKWRDTESLTLSFPLTFKLLYFYQSKRASTMATVIKFHFGRYLALSQIRYKFGFLIRTRLGSKVNINTFLFIKWHDSKRKENKKAVLSQRWPRDARYISRSWAVADIWPFKIVQDCGGRHLEFVRIENSAIRSAVPENPTLEPNMK